MGRLSPAVRRPAGRPVREEVHKRSDWGVAEDEELHLQMHSKPKQHIQKACFHLLVDQRYHKLFCLRACSGVIKKPDFLIFITRIWRATYAVLVFLKKRFGVPL